MWVEVYLLHIEIEEAKISIARLWQGVLAKITY